MAGASPNAVGSRVSTRTSPPPTTQTVLVVVVVSSSRPSSPRTTRTDDPRPANTSAITGARRASAQPTSAAGGCAGLVSGPSTFIAVGRPSSRRGPAACRIAGWKTGAKQNPIPAAATQAATLSGGRSMTTPRASRTSAAPQADDAARLPCLTTGTPAAATTTAAIDEMLTVCAWSPPVPTTSTAGSGTATRRACRSIASASPAISAAVSPLARRATRKPASCAGVASAESTRSITHAVSAAPRSSRWISRPRTPGQVRASATDRGVGRPGPAQDVGHRLGGGEGVERMHQHRVGLRPRGEPRGRRGDGRSR